MFEDDINKMKETLQNLNEVIGVFAVHDYPGMNREFLPHWGNSMIFQCDKESFFKYCEENDIAPKARKIRTGRVLDHYIEINGNIYFTLE